MGEAIIGTVKLAIIDEILDNNGKIAKKCITYRDMGNNLVYPEIDISHNTIVRDHILVENVDDQINIINIKTSECLNTIKLNVKNITLLAINNKCNKILVRIKKDIYIIRVGSKILFKLPISYKVKIADFIDKETIIYEIL